MEVIMATSTDSGLLSAPVCSLRDTETAFVASISFPFIREAVQKGMFVEGLLRVLLTPVDETLKMHLAQKEECFEKMRTRLGARMMEAGYCCSWSELLTMAIGDLREDVHIGECRFCQKSLAEIRDSLPIIESLKTDRSPFVH